MVSTAEELRVSLDFIAAAEPAFGAAIASVGYPVPRVREPGYETLLRTIVGQQVSVASAAAVWRKLEAELGVGCTPEALLARDFDALRACGLSRQKQGYARSLAEEVASGRLNFRTLRGMADEQAIEMARRLAKNEGIFAGFSSGANVAAAMELLKTEFKGQTAVVLICDSGLKYLSTDLWEK